MFGFNKEIDCYKFNKNYRIHDYEIINNKISFSYNEKITNRIKKYFDNGLIKELVDLDLVTPSILNNKKLKKNCFQITQPEFVQPIFLNELTPSMRKDAAILILKLSLILDKYNLMISEGSLTKVFFNKYRQPYFYDLAGIVEKEGFGFHYASFNKYFINFLRVIYLKPNLSTSLQTLDKIELSDYLNICNPIKLFLINFLLNFFGKKKIDEKLSVINNSPYMNFIFKRRYILTFLNIFNFVYKKKIFNKRLSKLVIQDLLREINAMQSFKIFQRWTNYYGHLDFNKIVNSDKNLLENFKNQRETEIIKLISNKKYKTLLDIGANGGYFSIISGLAGLKTIAMDNDLGALEMLYNNLSQRKFLPITPIFKSFTSMSDNELMRFKADVVLALGFIHHMRLVELLSWEIIAERLYHLTKHLLIIEFKADTGAKASGDWRIGDALNNYTMIELEKSFLKFFKSVRKVGNFSALGFESVRVMYVCKR